MQVGLIGLGKMGFNMALRWQNHGHQVVAHSHTQESVAEAAQKGMRAAYDLQQLVAQLATPRVVWCMVPAGETVDQLIQTLLPLLQRGDIIVDGGNSNYHDTLRRAKTVSNEGVHYVDVGTSGGIWGREAGYSLMVGGEPSVVEQLTPLLQALAPAADRGWGHVGPVGAGHFSKMIHNGIEYGLMQAYAEGFAILKGKEDFQFDLHQVAEIWRYGSVVRSWLLDLSAQALAENPNLNGIAPYVADSGEGRWTVKEAIDLDIPAPVITLALQQRFRSRTENSFADKLLAAMRNQFGGHAVKKESS